MAVPNVDQIRSLLPQITAVNPLTTGGQKSVFRATHKDFGDVVVKFVLSGDANERILREIDIASRNNFPHVPEMYQAGTVGGGDQKSLFIIERFIPGESLRSLRNRGERLTLPEIVQFLKDLLETIVELEKHDIVHRDIKPENIIRDTRSVFWLLDFGIARDLRQASLTATSANFGPHTAGYAAPEQFRNLKKQIDSQADLFSAGVVAYELATGRHPFADGARDYLDILRRTEMMAVAPLVLEGDSSGQLSKFILVLMEKFPSRRPPTAQMALDWLQGIVGILPS